MVALGSGTDSIFDRTHPGLSLDEKVLVDVFSLKWLSASWVIYVRIFVIRLR